MKIEYKVEEFITEKTLQRVLDRNGDDGWQLVTCEYIEGDYTLIFSRSPAPSFQGYAQLREVLTADAMRVLFGDRYIEAMEAEESECP